MTRQHCLDSLLTEAGHFLATVFATPVAQQPTPENILADTELTAAETQHAGGLMRVNHTGEICAQALYRGQALTARNPLIKKRLLEAAKEENDHLAWCQQRLSELHSHPSVLNFFWYSASFKIGLLAGLLGDAWNLGFVQETEQQVVAHLDQHLQELPKADHQSRAIVAQMRTDELRHATHAVEQGAKRLPRPVRALMALKSKVMTKTAYRF